jgi:integrase
LENNEVTASSALKVGHFQRFSVRAVQVVQLAVDDLADRLPAVVTLLHKHRTAQKVERLCAAHQWTDSGLVFTTGLGTVVDPRSLLRVIEAAAQAGIEDAGIHTLRRSVAVGWLESGVHIKAAADLLGHSSIAITGDVYGHVSDIAARSAVDGWSGVLGL